MMKTALTFANPKFNSTALQYSTPKSVWQDWLLITILASINQT